MIAADREIDTKEEVTTTIQSEHGELFDPIGMKDVSPWQRVVQNVCET